MLSTMWTVFSQVLVLFAIIATGYILTKKKIINETGLAQMTEILLMIVTPCVIVHAFSAPFQKARLTGLLISALAAFLCHGIAIFIGFFLFRKQPDNLRTVARMGMIFSNAGYMGLPLVQSVAGSEGVFYSSVYIAVFNLVLWTVGVLFCTPKGQSLSLKKAFINPGTTGLAAGLFVFLLSGHQGFMDSAFMDGMSRYVLPVPAAAIAFLAGLNTPLAMVIIGGHMARVSLKTLFNDGRIYAVTALRLLLVPVIMLMPVVWMCGSNKALIAACIIPACAPVAAATSLFAQKFEKDVVFASKCVALSTLFSIVTMPLFVSLAFMLGA